jgi:hypothetical protein
VGVAVGFELAHELARLGESGVEESGVEESSGEGSSGEESQPNQPSTEEH